MKSLSALLIFCEGSHDVAYCRLIFKNFFNIHKVSKRFSDYPSPLNLLFRTIVETHAAKDLSMNMAHKFFLPDHVLYSQDEDLIVLLFNSGGKSAVNPTSFLTKFFPLLKVATVLPEDANEYIHSCRYLFLYDRDRQDFDRFLIDFASDYGTPDMEPLRGNGFDLERVGDNAAISTDRRVGLYMFSIGDNYGTLEDILLPLFGSAHPAIAQKAENFIDGAFSWRTSSDDMEEQISEQARRKKAIITAMGQRKKSGMSMSVIIDQSHLLQHEVLVESPNVIDFANFIRTFSFSEEGDDCSNA